MKNRGIIHPRLLAMVTPGFYPSLCTISTNEVVINSFGDEVLTPTPVAGLTDIPCRLAPASSREVRGPAQTFVEALGHVSLAGYYPQIDSDMTPVIDGKSYAMEGEPEHDGNHKTTRFYVREVE
jgi:hypothetical protein